MRRDVGRKVEIYIGKGWTLLKTAWEGEMTAGVRCGFERREWEGGERRGWRNGNRMDGTDRTDRTSKTDCGEWRAWAELRAGPPALPGEAKGWGLQAVVKNTA